MYMLNFFLKLLHNRWIYHIMCLEQKKGGVRMSLVLLLESKENTDECEKYEQWIMDQEQEKEAQDIIRQCFLKKYE